MNETKNSKKGNEIKNIMDNGEKNNKEKVNHTKK